MHIATKKSSQIDISSEKNLEEFAKKIYCLVNSLKEQLRLRVKDLEIEKEVDSSKSKT